MHIVHSSMSYYCVVYFSVEANNESGNFYDIAEVLYVYVRTYVTSMH